MRLLAARAGAAGLLLAVVALAPGVQVHAATTGPRPPFEAAVARARLVVVGRVTSTADRITIEIARVLAGTGPPSGRLEYADPVDPPPLVDGGTAVIAFADPATIDSSAPTIAWQVTEDGLLDPDAVAVTEGLPPTLAAVYTWFGQPLAAGRADDSDLSQLLGPVILVLVALGLAEGGIARRERLLRGRHVP